MVADLESLWSSRVGAVALGVGVVVVMMGVLLKRHFAGGTCTSKARLDGKTAIVTGANTGIGKETALDLAARGARVILACRNEDKAVEAAREIIKETKSHQILVRKLDLSSFESIRKFAAEFNKEEERLDILINNAGIFAVKCELTEDEIESTVQVNYLSHFLLTLLLLQKLKSSSPSRIVNVSSLGHYCKSLPNMKSNEYSWAKCSEKDFNPGKTYGWSKLQQVLFTKELSKRLNGTGVTVNSLHPGFVKTEVFRSIPMFNNIIFKMIMTVPFFILQKTAKQGAQTTIYCAVDQSLKDISGSYFTDCKPKAPSKFAEDEELATRLWEISEELTGIKWQDVA